MTVKKQLIAYLVPSLFGVLFIFSACSKEKVVDVPVCFEKDVLPLLISNCTYSGCHNSLDREGGVELTSYSHIVTHGVVPGDYKASELYQVLISVGDELMPKKPYNRLTAEQIGTIALWIEQGAKYTKCATCDLSKVTYSKTVRPILDRSCNNCHAGRAPSGNIDLSTHANVKRYVQDKSLFGSINHDANFVPMPQGAGKLPSCEISSIKKWIDLGALNN
jgi:hypothetical protein